MVSISVCIPVGEDRGYLQHAIDSLESQTFTDWELWIEKGGNASENVNRAIKKSKGKYFCYLCDDDLLTPNSLQDRFEFMELGFDFIHTRGSQFFENGERKPYNLSNPCVDFESCLESNGIMGGSTMYRTELLKDNLLNESLWTCEEWELHLRLLSKGHSLGYLDKLCYLYRRHNKQKSIGNISHEYQAKRNKVKQSIRDLYSSNGNRTL